MYLHNHLIINLKYNRLDSDDNLGPSYRIVGFDVLPHSIDEMKPGMIIKQALSLRRLLSPIYPCGIRFESYSYGRDLKFYLIVEKTEQVILCDSNLENRFQFESYS